MTATTYLLTADQKEEAAALGISEADYYRFCVGKAHGSLTREEIEKCLDILVKKGFLLKFDEDGKPVDADGNSLEVQR